MKQKIIALFILVAFSGSLFADTGSALYGILFPGIKTDYTVNGVSKNTATTAMETQLKDAYTLFNKYQQQVVIGHSQGGYRALGYANYLKEKGEADKLKAVISIGAPARGFTPLIKGKEDLVRRLNSMVEIFERGATAGYLIPGITVVTPLILNTALFIGSLFYDDCPPSTEAFISSMISDPKNFVNSTVMEDLNPNSTYLKNRIAPNYIPEKGHWVKVKTGEIRVWFVVIPIYKSVWVIDQPAQTTYKMPANLKVGFIVGNQKNIFKLLSDMGTPNIEPYFKDAADTFGKYEDNNRTLAIAAAGAGTLALCGLNFPLAIALAAVAAGYNSNANDAQAAKDLARNFSDRYNKDILLTDSSDGFIPYAAQKWDPKTELGCQSITDRTSYSVYDVNHLTELEDDRIWGPGGDKDNPKENGKVWEWTSIAAGQWFGTSNYLKMEN